MISHNAETQLAVLASKLVNGMSAAGLRLALAESCTGGWLAKVITDVAGSSDVLDCGFVTYSNQSKTSMLDVPPELIQLHGAVSGPVVEAMVAGALANSKADVAVAVSGIAGPGGGTPDKPVGTVWIARMRRGEAASSTKMQFSGDREAVRIQSVMTLLEDLLSVLD